MKYDIAAKVIIDIAKNRLYIREEGRKYRREQAKKGIFYEMLL